MTALDSVPPSRRAPTLLYLILWLPTGLPFGYATVTLAYHLSHIGVAVAAIGGLAAIQLLPSTFRVLWAPLIDGFWTYKRWYAAGALGAGAMLIVTGFAPANGAGIPLLGVLLFTGTVSLSMVNLSAAGLMAHSTTAENKGRAAGWSQAGNIGGSGIGGGLGLWLEQHAGGLPVAATVLGLICMACILSLLAFQEPDHTHRAPKFLATVRNVGLDLWGLVRSRIGVLALVLVLMPMGTGAASNLWAAIAGDWRADADTVALVSGLAGGVVSAVGSILSGFLFDRMDRRTGYVISALLMTACTLAMAFAARTPSSFIVFTLGYALFNGFMFAGFYAVALEASGKGAAATKINLLACITNIPITVMTAIDGAAQTQHGSVGMLLTESAVAVASAVAFGVFALTVRRLWPRPIKLEAAA